MLVVGEPVVGTGEAALDRSHGDPERVGDLPVAEVGVVAQHHDLALPVPEAVEGAGHRVGAVDAVCRALFARARAARRWGAPATTGVAASCGTR